MERTVNFNGKELKLASSLFTIISYRNIFGTELFEDVEKLEKAIDGSQNQVGKFIDILFRLIYILHRPYTNDSYDQFLQGFDFSILSNTEELTALSKVIAELLGPISPNKENDNSPRK